MTKAFRHVIVDKEKTGPQVRKGKAMLKIHTNCLKSFDRLYDIHNTIMPAAEKAERLISTCLIQAGSSGYLDPDALLRILG